MRIAITGGAGFIGKHLVQHINSMGHQVDVIDNLSTGTLDGLLDLSNVKIKCLDITIDELPKSSYDVVIHLASPVSVQESLENPEKYKLHILQGSKRVFNWAKRIGVKRIVAASTAAVYGDSQQLPLSENSKTKVMSPYAQYKLEMESVLMGSEYDSINRAALRFFNVYGEGQNDLGGYVSVVPIFLKQFKSGKNLTVTGDGQQTRDFVYVKDVCEAIWAASIADFGQTLISNVGSGEETKVLEIAKAIGTNIDFIKARKEPQRSLADISAARIYLTWKPKTNLLDWLKQHNYVNA
jgi:UDP-glucose 4-epimerase